MSRHPLLGCPIIAAPTAGGPSTPDLVVSVAEADGLGFLAGGYKTPNALRAEIEDVRSRTDGPYGVNVFVPGEPSGPGSLESYVDSLQEDAAALDVQLGEPTWDDDHWDAKVNLLLSEAPPVVSFTFGCPPRELVHELQRNGTVVVITVTTPAEAHAAAATGARWVCAQGVEAGAHRGSHTNDPTCDHDWATLPLVIEITRSLDVGLIATGGITTASAVQAALVAGANSVQAGTAFLLCPEAGTNPTHRAALTDPANTTTCVTRSFSGRPARSITNEFITRHPDAPPAYPEINTVTRPLRTAAAKAGDASRMSLWAGQGFAAAQQRPAGEIVEILDAGAGRTRRARAGL